jgi:hypothetical protein
MRREHRKSVAGPSKLEPGHDREGDGNHEPRACDREDDWKSPCHRGVCPRRHAHHPDSSRDRSPRFAAAAETRTTVSRGVSVCFRAGRRRVACHKRGESVLRRWRGWSSADKGSWRNGVHQRGIPKLSYSRSGRRCPEGVGPFAGLGRTRPKTIAHPHATEPAKSRGLAHGPALHPPVGPQGHAVLRVVGSATNDARRCHRPRQFSTRTVSILDLTPRQETR